LSFTTLSFTTLSFKPFDLLNTLLNQVSELTKGFEVLFELVFGRSGVLGVAATCSSSLVRIHPWQV
jgi:hypothetical protein